MALRDSNPFGVLASTPSPGEGSPPHVQLLGAGEDEPQEVVIENVGFLALNGDTKVKIFTKGYESDSLPMSSASLFSIASRSGLFAAAEHSDLIIGSTSSLREAYHSTSEAVALYRPQISLSLPARISHVAFTADESHLVLGSASGGLAIYSVGDLNSTNAQVLFQLGTDGVGLREVKPNPAISEFVAIVTMNGDVQMLNTSTRGWEQGSSGQVLKSGASTVSWSQRGKQIVCGMGDGTIWQMTPQGEGKAVLPSIPGLDNHFVSSIVWLENHLFITTHTPVPSDPGSNESVFHILTRNTKSTSFQYTRLPDPVPPFGMDARAPPYFFHAIIKQYAPNLKDMVVFSNTVSSDIGLVSRFSTPISGEPSIPADTWCTTTIGDDTRRAQLPLSGESFQDTSPIGMALDLSNKENVKRPVGGEEIEASPGPLPILMVLNHEGLLSAWHVVYNDAIEKGEKYTGMVIYSNQDEVQQQPPPQQARPSTPPRPPSFAGILGSPAGQQTPPSGWGFGGSRPGQSGSLFSSPAVAGLTSPGQLPTGSVFGTGASSAFGKPAFGTSSFGQPSTMGTSTTSAFGSPSQWGSTSSGPATAAVTKTAGTAFGQTSVLGGKPAFGAPTALGTSTPAFGAPTALGLAKSAGSAFGQASALGGMAVGGSVFGGNALGTSGFGAYANKGGFGAAASTAAPNSGTPIWGTGNTIKTESTSSVFGAASTPGTFGQGGAVGFKIESAFKADGTAADDVKKPAAGGTFGTFGTGFGDALGVAQSTPRGITNQGLRDADMDADSDAEQDKPSDDEDEDIITPGARQQGGPVSPIKPATLSNVGGSPFTSVNKSAQSVFATSTPTTQSPFGQIGKSPMPQSPFLNWGGRASAFGTPTTQSGSNPFNPTPTKVPNNPYSVTPPAVSNSPLGTPAGATSIGPPFSSGAKQIASTFSPSGGIPSPVPKRTIPDAVLSDSAKTSPASEIPDAPLPPDFTTAEPVKDEIPDTPLPLDFDPTPEREIKQQLSGIEHIPLPPDFTTPIKSKQSKEDEIPSLPEGSPEGEGEADDEEEYEEEEEEYEEEEEEEEDEEEEDEDEATNPLLLGVNITPPKSGLFNYDPKPKTPQSVSPSGSSIFGSNASYQRTIGDSGLKKDAPFASLFGSSNTSPNDTKKASPSVSTQSGRDKDKKLGSGLGGGMFSKTPKKSSGRSSSSAVAQTSGGSLFPSPTPIPAPVASSSSLFPSTTTRPASAPSAFGGSLPAKSLAKPPAVVAPSTFEQSIQISTFPPTNKGVASSPFGGVGFVSAATKPVRSSPLAATPPRSPQQPKVEPEIVKEEPKEESDLDLDKEISDHEDEKIRRKLIKGRVKPIENLPKFKSVGEIEVMNDFNAVFDCIYLSGNMMVNRLGLTVMGLQAYRMGQKQPFPDLQHENAKDMKQPKDWKLCELDKVGKVVDELLVSVKRENKGNKDLEAMYDAANKGFIKLDTKGAEIKRLLAVHNDAQAAAIARARPLTTEQLLQQRKLRKEYTRIEKLLKDAEKDVTQLKASIASRDKYKPGGVVPPTVEAVRNTIMKLTGMVECKNTDIENLEERLRRLKLKSRASCTTPSRARGMTPERTLRGETPQRFGTPERSFGANTPGTGYGYPQTPVLALTDPADVAEAREEMKVRREMGKKLKGVLERNGQIMTGGPVQGQQGQKFGSGR